MEKILESNDFIDQELLYSNWLSALVDIMEPKDAFLILGRATAKTSDFLAKEVRMFVMICLVLSLP